MIGTGVESRTRTRAIAGWLACAMLAVPSGLAQKVAHVWTQDGTTISIEPYAPNVIRVTLSAIPEKASAPPGYGFLGQPSATGWEHQQDQRGNVFTSADMVLTVEASHPLHPTRDDLQLDKYFNFLSSPRAHVTVTTPQGKTLVDMLGWSMSRPNDSQGDTWILNDKRPSDEPFYRVSAVFASPADEHYYGLGQNQEGFLDLRGHAIHCWHDYNAPGGESVCVPFLISSRGYGAGVG